MAITNYGELKLAIANWLDRSDLTNRIPDFVTLAEDMIFRTLRCPGNEQMVVYPQSALVNDPISGEATTVNIDNSKNIKIPGDFLEAKMVMYNNLPLTRISDQRFGVQNYASRTGGIPTEFTRLKDKLWFYPPAGANGDVNLWYWQSQGPLVNDADFTRTLRYAPGLYLYGSLLQAQAYLIGDERIPVWQNQFNQIMGQLNEQVADDELAGSTVTVRNVYQ